MNYQLSANLMDLMLLFVIQIKQGLNCIERERGRERGKVKSRQRRNKFNLKRSKSDRMD